MNLKENISYCCNFGVSLSFWKSLNTIIRKTGKNSISWCVKDINNNTIEKYICKKCKKVIALANMQNYKEDCTYCDEKNNNEVKINSTIWVMWWQGEENAPEIVKKCIQSIRLNAGNHDVIVIDEKNYSDYINIPEYLIDKYIKAQMDRSSLRYIGFTTTHFSDVIRSLLLYEYGGIWIDATCYVTGKIPDEYFTRNIVTLGEDNEWFIAKGKWSIWFIGTQKGNLAMKFLYQMHVEYILNEKYWVNYLLVYFIMDIFEKNFPQYKNYILPPEYDNTKALFINRNYNAIADMEFFKKFIKKQKIHKLSWKWNDLSSNKNTYLNVLLDYGNELKNLDLDRYGDVYD